MLIVDGVARGLATEFYMQLAQYCLNAVALAYATRREAAAMRHTSKRLIAEHGGTRGQDRLTLGLSATIQVCAAGAAHEERVDTLAVVKGDA